MNLQKEIERTGLTVKEIGKALFLAPEGFMDKLQADPMGNGGLSLTEAFILADLIAARGGNGNIDYLFRPES